MARYFEDAKRYADHMRDKNRIKSQIAGSAELLQVGKQGGGSVAVSDSIRVRYRGIGRSFCVGHPTFGAIGPPGTGFPLTYVEQHFWPLNGDSTDSTGSLDGADTDVTYISGKFGDCASFNGSTSKITIGEHSDFRFGTDSFSISAWVKHPSINGGVHRGIITKGDGSNSGEWSFYIPGYGAGAASVRFGGDDKYYTGTTRVDDDDWHHVVVTKNSTTNTIKIYVDTNEDLSTTTDVAAMDLDDAVEDVIIGKRGGATNFDGEIQDVRLFNFPLQPGDISYIYNSDSGTAEQLGGPNAAWTSVLDEL